LEHRALGRGHLATVDHQTHGVPDLAGHATPTLAGIGLRPGGAIAVSPLGAPSVAPGTPCWIASLNSPRNFFTIEPTGIAIESPRTQRQLPMMFVWTDETVSRSIGVAWPPIIRSSIFTVQLVPSRQGVHFPQDSWW